MKRRNAFTLVEMLMTMTMGSSLMLLAIGLVHQSMSMSKLAKVRGEHDQTLARLAQQFRSDVHLASELISVSADSIHLKLADETTVTYKGEAANLARVKTGPGSDIARELFRFDERCTATFASEAKPERAVLQVERRVESAEISSAVDLRVAAVVGRWQQLEQAGGNQP
jgi:prepilin-type N-terminal cleavage/methylation domain-containing protein